MSEEQKQQDAAAAPAEAGGDSLLDQLIESARIKPGDDAYSITKQGIQAFISQLLEPQRSVERVTQATVDGMIADLDRKLCAQVDAILHHADYQRLESAWRSLKFLVDRTNFRENVKLQLLSVSKSKLLDDFQDAADITKSGLYRNLYTAEYGQFGGQPFGAIVANYEFGPGGQDIKLLQYAASVSAMSHAPFIAAAGPQFFGVDSFDQLPNLKDLSSVFEGPQFVKWNSFRETEDARYIGLTLPHFLLRVPYGPDTVPAKKFSYTEDVSGGNGQFLWGNAAFTFASRLTESFADYRWCANVIGPQGGGAVNDLPVYTYESMGELQNKIPTEVLISERREFELAEQGFIALTMRKNSDNAAFFSANSAQKPKFFGNSKEGKEAELNYKLSTQLPYMFVVSRLAHYIKVIQRENIGTWKERGDLESELNVWIRQYVADMDNPAEGVRSRRPLRQAEITVADVEGDPGWYRVDLKVRPHFKYMGASFTLSLVGKLDKK
ncbi:type VI secretion system contractile sheath large subunit [Paraburkholderia caballeronis]|uniref:Type VI secretion system protein ImpC n=1 Tax=Paraburkholderia caballeronis TaxID=416943 RepID=A0A1H7UC03_9BURK|nr:type VI secretion system contractile sheath large subunit [Paraburkholderia caballeronis]PXW23291.1 type VI secretion system protein ImpC [Paraburkholderia caballeronis]PXW98284.1 type VI secretion system protein ImpC [Paraburkholderia caballeronis]RAJ95014.1 type VI secretion system protein ImpC [Paraburkholderia caballeronis]SEC61635.1 type VI secretion system protein ImpC [Paraburkholderia caballeronis]SEL94215.1 type VI secretion system protein ImpC [Paraburkholderia caballeronis]